MRHLGGSGWCGSGCGGGEEQRIAAGQRGLRLEAAQRALAQPAARPVAVPAAAARRAVVADVAAAHALRCHRHAAAAARRPVRVGRHRLVSQQAVRWHTCVPDVASSDQGALSTLGAAVSVCRYKYQYRCRIL